MTMLDKYDTIPPMNATEKMPVLGRCREKGCDYALWSAPEDIQQAATLYDVVPGAAYRMTDRGNLLARCPHKHKVFRLYQVEGEYDPNVKCDGRCEGARGNVCRCACGGMNHGRGHAGPAVNVSALAREMTNQEGVERFNRETGRWPHAQDATEAKVRDDEAQVADEPYPVVEQEPLFGEIGGRIEGKALVTHEQDVNETVLILFRACVDGKFGTIKWFKPTYVNLNYAKGDTVNFTAKVKKHQDNEYGRATIVTYFEGSPDE